MDAENEVAKQSARDPGPAWAAPGAHCVVVLTVGLMLLEWMRQAAPAGACKASMDTAVRLVLSRFPQVAVALLLCAVLVKLLWIKIRILCAQHPSPDETGSDEARLLSLLRDALKCILGIVAAIAFVSRWKSMPPLASARYMSFGVDQSLNAVVLLAGMALSLGMGCLLAMCKDEQVRKIRRTVLGVFVLFLALSSFHQMKVPLTYNYREAPRSSGLWVNPNLYGVLMAAGVVMAAGLAWSEAGAVGSGKHSRQISELRMGCCAAGLIVLGAALMKSYSRGAWVAAFSGLIYLGRQALHVRPPRPTARKTTASLRAKISIFGLCALASIAVWQCHGGSSPISHRIFSIGNPNDFSWRNRIEGWIGAMDMIADKPYFGCGWNDVQALYENDYSPFRLSDSRAILLNEILEMGIILGAPALGLFLLLIYLHLRAAPRSPVDSAPFHPDRSRTTCAACTVVFFVGFWFDGGLFKMATAAPFWLLLELGAWAVKPETAGRGHRQVPAQRPCPSGELPPNHPDHHPLRLQPPGQEVGIPRIRGPQ